MKDQYKAWNVVSWLTISAAHVCTHPLSTTNDLFHAFVDLERQMAYGAHRPHVLKDCLSEAVTLLGRCKPKTPLESTNSLERLAGGQIPYSQLYDSGESLQRGQERLCRHLHNHRSSHEGVSGERPVSRARRRSWCSPYPHFNPLY